MGCTPLENVQGARAKDLFQFFASKTYENHLHSSRRRKSLDAQKIRSSKFSSFVSCIPALVPEDVGSQLPCGWPSLTIPTIDAVTRLCRGRAPNPTLLLQFHQLCPVNPVQVILLPAMQVEFKFTTIRRRKRFGVRATATFLLV
jgi:hypothetical protein